MGLSKLGLQKWQCDLHPLMLWSKRCFDVWIIWNIGLCRWVTKSMDTTCTSRIFVTHMYFKAVPYFVALMFQITASNNFRFPDLVMDGVQPMSSSQSWRHRQRKLIIFFNFWRFKNDDICLTGRLFASMKSNNFLIYLYFFLSTWVSDFLSVPHLGYDYEDRIPIHLILTLSHNN